MVDLWWASPDDAREDLLDWFTPDERERAEAYHHDIDRRRFVVGCALTRRVASVLLSVPPGDVPLRRDCPDCDRPHGRPVIDGVAWSVSVSHSGAAVVVAVTSRGPVGVDVEEVTRGRRLPVSLTLAEAERGHVAASDDPDAAFFRYWVRKEAVIKATGEGLRTPPASVVVSAPGGPPRLLSGPGLDPSEVALADVTAPAGHAAAVAVIGVSTISPRWRDGSAALLVIGAGPGLDALDKPFIDGQS